MSLTAFVFLLLGLLFILLSGIGLLRMPTFFARLQATSKASTLGSMFTFLAACFHFQDLSVMIKSLGVMALLLVGTSVATHAMIQAAKLKHYDKR